MSNVTSSCLGHWVDRLNELKIDKGPGSLGFTPGQDPKPFAREWVKCSGGGEGNFLGFLDTGASCTVVPDTKTH